ncbi:class I glutamine amidotransferase-like protein [Tribonema minus]|uniref:Class I glutamine amidotransferase-like protein n=1 Tax=Tribonema minus TaxID=303371 RepID=A0A835ZGI6_9STRA|nr:class I glutamine amidotransferase-like protein [Tribonema minus]
MAKKILIILGDFVEDYEIFVVFQVLLAYGYEVDAVCPGKSKGDTCRTAVHDFLPGLQTYAETRGHNFTLSASFDTAMEQLDSYAGLYVPGGRSPEYLSLNAQAKDAVRHFFDAGKPVASICHGQQLLAAAGVLKGRSGTGYPAIQAQCTLGGCAWVAPDPITMAHTDGSYVSAAAWPAHPALVAQFVAALGGAVEHKGGAKKILALCGDFMEDLEIMVPFQGLLAMGHSVDAVCPGRVKGEKCATAVHDFEGDQTYTEKPGHKFELTAGFDDAAADVESYDALLIPGGRAPEYLSMDPKVLAIVKHFFATNKPVASICHGQIILAAAEVLNGRMCTCYPAVQPTVEAAGAEFVAPDPIDMCVTQGNLVTGAAWPGHPQFLQQFAALLGTTITP